MIATRRGRIFRRGSRTYFYSSLFFTAAQRRDVFSLYAFVRTADDFVDRVPQDGAGLERFAERYHAALAGQASGDEVIDAFVELAIRRRFEAAWTESFLDAMRQDLVCHGYADLAAIEAYMYGSAEVIGLFMGRLLELPDIALPHARCLGKAMQYANFLRDVAEDRLLGRTYIPRTVLAEHALSSLDRAEIAAHPDRFEALMRSEIDRYRQWQSQAEAGYGYLPARAWIPIVTAAEMYRWATDQIARRPLVILERQVKPSIGRILARVAWNTVAAAQRPRTHDVSAARVDP